MFIYGLIVCEQLLDLPHVQPIDVWSSILEVFYVTIVLQGLTSMIHGQYLMD
jgi:hypothetical protein